jgi:desulfoferrodoxin (superoxide reductase-like protein)
MARKIFALTLILFAAALLGASPAWANKAAVSIEAPKTAAKGSEIVIRVTATHSRNSAHHHIEWLWIKVNGKEVGRWDYTGSHLPEGATFTKEIKWKVDGDMEIRAKANCNLHGSKGEGTATVKAKE